MGTDTDLVDTSNRVAPSNGAIDDALLNTGGAGEPTRDEVLDFINGFDAADHDKDRDKGEPRNQMGDPLHAQPVSVIYGPDLDDAIVYFATNDGFLHAIDASTGEEQWAFIPPRVPRRPGRSVHRLQLADEALRHRRQPASADESATTTA